MCMRTCSSPYGFAGLTAISRKLKGKVPVPHTYTHVVKRESAHRGAEARQCGRAWVYGEQRHSCTVCVSMGGRAVRRSGSVCEHGGVYGEQRHSRSVCVSMEGVGAIPSTSKKKDPRRYAFATSQLSFTK